MLPSFPCPTVAISSFEIKNIRIGTKHTDYECDLQIKGIVTNALGSVLAEDDATIEKCSLFVNGSERPVTTLPLKAEKRGAGSGVLSAPFTGELDVLVTGVRITSGNNTFKVAAADKVYGLDGYNMWAATFVLPDDSDEDDEKQDKSAIAKPAYSEKAEHVTGGTGGELCLYGLMVEGVPADEASKLVLTIGQESPVNCRMIAAGAQGSYYAKRPNADLPLLFSFRPPSPGKGDSKVDEIADEKGVNASPSASLPEREAFLAAFSCGFFYYGADLVAGTKTEAIRAVDFSPVTGLLTLHSHISLDNHSLRSFATTLPTKFDSKGFPAANPFTTSEIAWQLAKLYRVDDPRAKEVTLALLLGDFKDVGLESVKIEDWRSDLFVYLAEILDSLLSDTKRNFPNEQGYLVGRCFSEITRLCMKPGTNFQLGITPKSVVLTQLLKSHFFSDAKTLSPIKSKKTSIVETLKKFFGF